MSDEIRAYEERDRDAVVALSLRAWEPVHASMRRELGDRLYLHMIPDWRVSQRAVVTRALESEEEHVWVSVSGGAVTGFASVRLRPAPGAEGEDGAGDGGSRRGEGEVTFLAVDPGHQGRGVGVALTEFAVDWIRDRGMGLAIIETGGDEGHAPARSTYSRAGLTPMPIVRYFKKL
ncbi:GNAT family N-acetyltransferase [Nocardiopsis sp. CT-R113]|uniref:GNAT family N-acetyltransferase n=1 Tax=Nocardiopsis codii TaxID=3065942 RepID=A0ABU7K325_9ACTN|nr:GNAT family N-acetyltransferase [Nocardiopsis sp. CT-R113]MEE2036633.1 GNAT family N-acetyltransferase [Nocardiopsis sp. CT-R113]